MDVNYVKITLKKEKVWYQIYLKRGERTGMHRIDDIPQQVAAIEQCLVNACCVGKERFKKAAEITIPS